MANQQNTILWIIGILVVAFLIGPRLGLFATETDSEFDHIFMRYTDEGNVVTYWVSSQREIVRTVPNARQLFNNGLLDQLPEPPPELEIDLDPSTDPPTVDIPFGGRTRVLYATNRLTMERFQEIIGWNIIKDESGRMIAPTGDEMKSWARVSVPRDAFEGKRKVNLPSGSIIFYRIFLNDNQVGEKTISWEEYKIEEGCEYKEFDSGCSTEMANCRNAVSIGTVYWTTADSTNNIKVEAGFRSGGTEIITDRYSLSYTGIFASEFDDIAEIRALGINAGEIIREDNSITEDDVTRTDKLDLTKEQQDISDTVIVTDGDLITDTSGGVSLDLNEPLFKIGGFGVTLLYFIIGLGAVIFIIMGRKK